MTTSNDAFRARLLQMVGVTEDLTKLADQAFAMSGTCSDCGKRRALERVGIRASDLVMALGELTGFLR